MAVASVIFLPVRVKIRVACSATSNNCRIFAADPISPDGGIGRRVGLKHQWTKVRAGSIPALGTMDILNVFIISAFSDL